LIGKVTNVMHATRRYEREKYRRGGKNVSTRVKRTTTKMNAERGNERAGGSGYQAR
jgi:hypothetical protein